MKNRITTILGFALVFTLLIPMGCAHSQGNGAAILLKITDPASLFQDYQNPAIGPNDPRLKYLEIQSEFLLDNGDYSTEETDAVKSARSKVKKNRPTIWKIQIIPASSGYSAKLESIVLGEGSYNPNCDEQPGGEGPCQIFDSFVHPSSGNQIVALVNNDDSVICCEQRYAILFNLTYNGVTHTYILDPFVIAFP
jgi:hypothetical protein